MAKMAKMTRLPEGATDDQRHEFGRQFYEKLDEIKVGPEDDFLLVPASAVEKEGSIYSIGEVDEDSLGPFARSSETSRRASVDNYPRTGKGRHEVLVAIMRSGDGLSRQEISERIGMNPDTVRPRVKELLEGGWIEVKDDDLRTTAAGNDAEVLIATGHALDEARNEGDLEPEPPAPAEQEQVALL